MIGAEDLTWVEPDDDSAMQRAIHRALREPVTIGGKPGWVCGVCRVVVSRAHFKRHLRKHDREGTAKSTVDAAWRAFDSRANSQECPCCGGPLTPEGRCATLAETGCTVTGRAANSQSRGDS